MEEPTTEQKLKALADAGKTVAKKATEEEIDMLYMELEIEQEDKAKSAKTEPVKPVAVEKEAKGGTYEDILATANPAMGDKDPVVVAWCKENMDRDEFELKYEGRI